MMKLYIYTDGASRGNPGESASGYRLFDPSKKIVHQHVFYNGICTNNVAEYEAIIAALKEALERDCDEIVLHSDSKLVINQISGAYKIKDRKLKELNSKARALLSGFEKHTLLNVPRSNREVSAVDKELNIFLDARSKEKPKKGKGQPQTKL
jgi:ribonuclease HI